MSNYYTNRKSIWTTLDGKDIRICDLEESHLFNLVKYVELRCEYSTQFVQMGDGLSLRKLLKEEVSLRGLESKFQNQFKRSVWANPIVVKEITPSIKALCEVMNQYPVEKTWLDAEVERIKERVKKAKT